MTAPREAASLAAAMAALGFPCEVEPRGALALVSMRAEDAARLASPPARSAALALARQHGFTHLAVELRSESGTTSGTELGTEPRTEPDGGRAAVLRD